MHALRGLGIIVALAFIAAGAHAQGPPPASVVLDPARLETLEQWREVTGRLRAVRRAVLASQEEGLVVALDLVEGDGVKAGQEVARLHDVRARLEVERAEAAVASRRATVAERAASSATAQRDWDRYRSASSEATISVMELDRIRSIAEAEAARLESARADLDWAESDLATARQRLEDMTIRAPFDGRIVAKRTEVGQWLATGGPVAEVIALDAVEAWLDVPERYISRLGEDGAVVQVRCDAVGRTVEAPVGAVIPDADPLSRLFPVRIRLPNPDGTLRPGMSIVGLVPTGSSAPTLTISKDAVLRNDAGAFVYFDAGGVAAVAPITPLFAAGDRIAIASGALPPDARVVVEGNERLFPGQPIAGRLRAPPGSDAR